MGGIQSTSTAKESNNLDSKDTSIIYTGYRPAGNRSMTFMKQIIQCNLQVLFMVSPKKKIIIIIIIYIMIGGGT